MVFLRNKGFWEKYLFIWDIIGPVKNWAQLIYKGNMDIKKQLGILAIP
jgi:hypothetical protein